MKAVDENDLHEKLKNDNMFLLDLKEETSTRKSTKRLKLDRLADFSERLEDDLYILPSSIHEVILLPKRLSPEETELLSMVRSINETELSSMDRLSDNLYEYRRDSGKIFLFC